MKTLIIYYAVWLFGVWFGYQLGSAPEHNDWE